MPGREAQKTQLAVAMEKGIPFTINAGGAKYHCQLQDRNAYERIKTTRTNSSDSVATSSTVSDARST